jgi:hypothetical protein
VAGGGLLGYKVSSVLSSTISVYGAFIALVFLGGVSFILLFNISLDDVFSYVGRKTRKYQSFPKVLAYL